MPLIYHEMLLAERTTACWNLKSSGDFPVSPQQLPHAIFTAPRAKYRATGPMPSP